MQFKITHPTPGTPLLTQVDITLDATRESSTQALQLNWGDTTLGATDGPSPTDTKLASGVLTAQHTYTKAGFYRIRVSTNEVSRHADVQVGAIGDSQIGPIWSAEAIYDNTIAGRQAKERQKIPDMLRPRGKIGAGSALKRIREKVRL